MNRFDDYLARARNLLAEGFGTKQAKKDALDYCNRAFETQREAVKQAHYDYRDNNNLSWTDHRGNDEWTAMRVRSENFPFQLSNWRGRHADENRPHNPDQVTRIEIAAKLREEIKAAPVVKKPPQRTPKQIAEDAMKRTCQICGRPIFAETGVIAHHGYQRPGDGWQTDSCEGARHLPYEADKSILVEHVKWQRQILTGLQKERDTLAKELDGVVCGYEVPRLQDGKKQYARGRLVTMTVRFTVTRHTFADIKAAHPEYFRYGEKPYYTFDTVLARDLAIRDQGIENQRHYLTWQEGREAAWKPLEVWDVASQKWLPAGA